MSTKGHPPVRMFSPESLEKIAYTSVESIPTREPNDTNRLGYHVWLYLKHEFTTLDLAVRAAEARLLIPIEQAVAEIDAALKINLSQAGGGLG